MAKDYKTTKPMPFGKYIEFQTEIVNGTCPRCRRNSLFVGVARNLYRCTSCGIELEQKVNGVISYIPATTVGNPLPKLKLVDERDPKNVTEKG